jgi:starch phosphorylase
MNENPGTPFALEVRPRIPERLARLEELANNLWYSWHRATRALFARLNPAVWEAVGYSPKAFLKSVHERQLIDASEDPTFLHDYNQILAAYDAYHDQPERVGTEGGLAADDLIAYFCAEFGFHESLPIYSGGLGILAGDHCKTASDMGLPFVAVGLLYRQGYFQQSIDAEGNQHAVYNDSDFSDLPITPVVTADGEGLEVTVEFGDREVQVKVWQAKVGRVTLYLLDTDLPANRPEERATAHRLYGGDRDTRIKQEIVLGIGGVRALAAMGIKPTVWHINEGHAAFLIVERTRELMLQGLQPAEALEAIAANTIFTTHTAVAAGHDHFSEEMVVGYFQRYARELKVSLELMLGMGRTGQQQHEFNMTALAARGSRFQNGVSKIHGHVSARLLSELWPEIPIEESPIGSVTNGVHVESFLAPAWADHFDRFVNGWNRRLDDPRWIAGIMEMPDHMYWSVRQQLKSRMFASLRKRVSAQHFRNQGSEAHLDRVLKLADPANPHALTIGFGRRFATYKRATLLFDDLDWLRQIVCDEERPVLFLFSGKAHPADQPGKDMIKRVIEVARMPEFEGRILFVEGYDLRLARRLVSGVDVWLNNPVYPMEASGTSGMKAAFNGVINLSVLDGWWDEGYQGDNGWAVKPASPQLDDARRAHEESRALYELLQDRVIPLYYARGQMGYSPEWIQLSKRSMMSLMPQFNSHRMVGDYLRRFYLPAANQGKRIVQDNYAAARDLAAWKERVRKSWQSVKLRTLQTPRGSLYFGDSTRFEVAAAIDGLDPRDIVVELLMSATGDFGEDERPMQSQVLLSDGRIDGSGEHRYAIDLAPALTGTLEYRLRAYPYHPALTHRFEMGRMKWL